MLNRKMVFSLLFVFGLMTFVGVCRADEQDFQEEYGYTLMEVPNDVKQDFFDKNQKSWEESVYSERLLFLQQWKIEKQKEELRDNRLELELKRQKQEEELRLKTKELDKQKKDREKQVEEQMKTIESNKEKLRLKQKHNTIFTKMRDLRNKQIQREQEHK